MPSVAPSLAFVAAVAGTYFMALVLKDWRLFFPAALLILTHGELAAPYAIMLQLLLGAARWLFSLGDDKK